MHYFFNHIYATFSVMDNKLEYQSTIFSNIIKKKYKEYRKWARKNRVSCYRLYDRNIPEIPLSLDIYEFLPDDISTTIEAARFLSEQNFRLSQNDPLIENEIKERRYIVLYLYERPYEKDEKEEEIWFETMANAASEVLNVDKDKIIKKQRKHQKGLNQYEKNDESQHPKKIIQEQGQLFYIDLHTYLDTGLFFDHRPLRSIIRDTASNKSILNLFCYTGSFSVYAAQGNAKNVESVDLSNTYLAWAKSNMEINSFTDKKKYVYTRKDVLEFLKEKIEGEKKEKYDIIILDPPTFSNSKSTQNILDINKQWPSLVSDCINILNPGGILYFSTNSTRLTFDNTLLPQTTKDSLKVEAIEMTSETIPKDFENTKCHKCFKISVSKE